MPFVTRQGTRLYWRSNGKAHLPALLLLNSIGTEMGMWDGVVPWLEADFHVIRMDCRGHGASDVASSDFAMDALAADSLAVLDAAGVERAHLCGLSMGGMIALQLALDAPERVHHVVVANSSAEMPADPWQQRAALVRREGMAAVADLVEARFFSPQYRAADKPGLANVMSALLRLDPQGYAGACEAIARLDLFSRLSGLRAPLLVINGDGDVATPGPQHGDRIAAQVEGARTASLPCGHMSPVEMPREFAGLVADFFKE